MEFQPENAGGAGNTGNGSETGDLRQWYFVCRACGAKWFAALRIERCPRCRAAVVALEKHVPPWRLHQRKNVYGGAE
jgi:rubrerythrin